MSSRPERLLLRAALGGAESMDLHVDDWASWMAVAEHGRVLPLLHRVASCTSSLDADAMRDACDGAVAAATTCVRLEMALLDVAELFDGTGVPYAVLKGAATAHLDHFDPALRQFGDIDLLVSPDDMPRAVGALRATGWAQAYPLPRHHESFTHAITFRRDGDELDLHQRVARRALGRSVATADLLAARRPYVVAGRELAALSDTDRLVHAALHLVSSRGQYQRLSSATDVLVMANRKRSPPADVLARAQRWKVRPLIERAITDVYDRAGLPLPVAWAKAMSTPVQTRNRWVERAYLGRSRRVVWEEAAHLRLMNWRERVTYTAGHVSPGPEVAGDRRREHGGRARYLASRAGRRA